MRRVAPSTHVIVELTSKVKHALMTAISASDDSRTHRSLRTTTSASDASTVANTFGATEIQKNFISGTRRRNVSAAAVPPADRVSDAPKGRANSSYCAVGSRM